MFCYQCQEAGNNKGCTVNGVCGKTGKAAELQDLLLFVAKGIAVWSIKARSLGVHDKAVDEFLIKALFTTITNVNFDAGRLYDLSKRGLMLREKTREAFAAACKKANQRECSMPVPECATWQADGTIEEFAAKGAKVGVLSCSNEDIRSLRELLIYGAKGIAAYADHAAVLGYTDDAVPAFLEKALAATVDDTLAADSLVSLVLEAGKTAVDTMALLDKANTESYGVPEITEVFTGTVKGPGILVSGHDLKDLDELLKQTAQAGVNVYTHGEMLPANAYPAFKKYKHLIGNYGTSWYNQQQELADFNGPVVFTTNCLQKPKESYFDRVYTTGLTGWENVRHIPDRVQGNPKDFSMVIKQAKALGSIAVKEGKKLTIGFNHRTTLALAGTIVDAIKAGQIKRFVVMAGCDGRQKTRNYFTEVAEALPDDTVILTAGCAKYRYNMLDLGTIGGIPRVIDAGQCNDSYSLAVVALALAEQFGLKDLNQLPLSFDIAWYEQKAVCVLLALLYLGIKNIRLGPTLPAFLSPNVVTVLVDKFAIKGIENPALDVQNMLAGK